MSMVRIHDQRGQDSLLRKLQPPELLGDESHLRGTRVRGEGIEANLGDVSHDLPSLAAHASPMSASAAVRRRPLVSRSAGVNNPEHPLVPRTPPGSVVGRSRLWAAHR